MWFVYDRLCGPAFGSAEEIMEIYDRRSRELRQLGQEVTIYAGPVLVPQALSGPENEGGEDWRLDPEKNSNFSA